MQRDEPATTVAVDLSDSSFPAPPSPVEAAIVLEDTLSRALDRLERSPVVSIAAKLVLVPLVIAGGAVLALFALMLVTVLAPIVPIALAWYAVRHDRRAPGASARRVAVPALGA